MSGFEYEGAINEISADISKLELLADPECKNALKQCGDVYKKQVATFSGGTAKFSGIGVGARASVKKSKQGTGYFLVVKGSKKYAPLWHLANNGFLHVGGTKIAGSHFVDKAQQASEGQVNAIIDGALKKMIGE